MLVTPRTGSTPLQPTNAMSGLIVDSTIVASGFTSECCSGRSVPPVTTTVIRGAARSSSSAMFSPLVTTVAAVRSSRAPSAVASAVVVVPTSSATTSPLETSAAAARAIAAFSSACDVRWSSKERSARGLEISIAPPCTRRTSPSAASASRSARTVTSETPKRSPSSITRRNSFARMAASIASRRAPAGSG